MRKGSQLLCMSCDPLFPEGGYIQLAASLQGNGEAEETRGHEMQCTYTIYLQGLGNIIDGYVMCIFACVLVMYL
jgi:hypothetical protein